MRNRVTKREQGMVIPKRVVFIPVIAALILSGGAMGLTNNARVDCMPHEYLNLLSDKAQEKVKKIK